MILPQRAQAQASPSITQQPQSQSVLQSSNAVFTVVASGQAPLVYRWYVGTNQLFDGGRISGASQSALTISNVVPGDAGNYWVTVSNRHDLATSALAALTVLVPPGFTVQPASQAVEVGTNVTFNGMAAGSGTVSYRWQKNGTNLTDGGRVSGTGTPTLMITGIQTGDAGLYRLVASNYVGVTASTNATLAVVPVLTWGLVRYGEHTAPAGATNLVAVDSSAEHTLALREDGAVLAWGYNFNEESTVPAAATNVVAVSAGNYHSLALRGDGRVVAWGWGVHGQTTVPAEATNVVAIAAGFAHSLALRSDGVLIPWGAASYGQPNIPVQATNVLDISEGAFHVLASRADGTVVAWGDNMFGQITVPPEATNVVAISAGREHNLALRADGTVVAWGYNNAGQASPPPGLQNVVAIAAGGYHSLALKADGTVIGWGQASDGQLQTPIVATNTVAVAAGYWHSVGLLADSRMRMPPRLWRQPAGREVLAGQTVILRSTVLGALPLRHQWWFNGSPLPAQTNGWLALSGIRAWQAGDYQVTIANNFGAVTSTVASVSVLSPPEIAVQPASQAVLLGSNAIFTVSATGDAPLTYQWQRNGANLSDGALVAGSTSPALTLLQVQAADAAGYRVVITNAHGAVTSLVANLIVNQPATIATPPTNQSVLLGGNVTFTAAAAGSLPLAYQWRKDGLELADGGRISGVATDALTISGVETNDAGTYQMVVTNAFGSATSDGATLTVLLPPVFVVSPTNQTAILGANLNFEVLATGTGTITYQWYRGGNPLVDDGRIVGAASNSLSIFPVQSSDAGNYTVVAVDAVASVSAAAIVTVITPPTITGQPRGYSVPVGLPVTLSGAASGTAPLKYQWLLNGIPVANATNTSLVMSNLASSQFGAYQLVATNLGGAATSSVAPLTIGPVGCWGNIGTVASFPIWPGQGLTNVHSVAAGSYYSAALRGDGTVYVWGNNSSVTNVPAGLANVVCIAAGANHVLALVADGTVRAWGLGSSGQTNVPAGLSNVVAVSAGMTHSAALRADGTVVVWGSTTRENQTNIPPGLMNVAAIDAGGNHTLALREGGTVAGWGGSSVAPMPAGLGGVVDISSAPGFSPLNFALLSNGTVRAWGAVGFSSAGLNVPAGLGNVIAVEGAGGGDQTLGVGLALRSNRTVTAWGNSFSGLTNVPPGLSNVFSLAGGPTHAVALVGEGRPLFLRPPVGGTFHTGRDLVFKTEVVGAAPLAFQWFRNGDSIPGGTNQNLMVPQAQIRDAGSYYLVVSNALGVAQSLSVPVMLLDGAPQLMSQPASRLAYCGSPWSVGASVIGSGPLDLQWFKDGLPVASGVNVLGYDRAQSSHAGAYQLIASNALGSVTSSVAQVKFTRLAVWGSGSVATNPPADLDDVVGIAAGGYTHALLIRSNGTVVSWGSSAGATNVPAGLSNVVAVSAGISYSLALREDGTVVAWHFFAGGVPQVAALPADLSAVAAISAGASHALALLSNGTVRAWGSNSSGQTNVPPNLSNVVAVSAGSSHSLALKSDGTVAGWGTWATTGNVSTNLTNVVAIAAGYGQSLALKSDGTVVTWDSGGKAALMPAGLSNVVAISSVAGSSANYGSHNLALKSDGTLVAWGSTSSSAQLNVPSEIASAIYPSCGAGFSLALLNDRSPVITVQPWGHQTAPGSNITLTAFAVGQPALEFQWLQNGAELAGATGVNLALGPAHPSLAGGYQLVAMNEFGAVTSAVATVTVTIPTPVLAVTGLVSNGFTFSFTSMAGIIYVVEHTASLNPAAWVELERRFGAGAVELVIDANALAERRFYRVRALYAPNPGLKAPVWNGGNLELQLNTVPGARYVVEYKEHLDDPDWIELFRQEATGSSLEISDPGPHGASRFYRARVE